MCGSAPPKAAPKTALESPHERRPAFVDIVIDAKGLSKSFGGRKVVDKLSMQVRRGRIHGFLGPNGSGKTTTIRMLCGLLTPDEGEGFCLGFDIRTQRTRSSAAPAT